MIPNVGFSFGWNASSGFEVDRSQDGRKIVPWYLISCGVAHQFMEFIFLPHIPMFLGTFHLGEFLVTSMFLWELLLGALMLSGVVILSYIILVIGIISLGLVMVREVVFL
jgi:hypothetical protein